MSMSDNEDEFGRVLILTARRRYFTVIDGDTHLSGNLQENMDIHVNTFRLFFMIMRISVARILSGVHFFRQKVDLFLSSPPRDGLNILQI